MNLMKPEHHGKHIVGLWVTAIGLAVVAFLLWHHFGWVAAHSLSLE